VERRILRSVVLAAVIALIGSAFTSPALAASSREHGVRHKPAATVNRASVLSHAPHATAVHRANAQGQGGGLGANFDGVSSLDSQVTNFGLTFEPPDQGLCVGNGFVVEATNSVLRVFDTNGTALTAVQALNPFFGYAAAINRATGAFGADVIDPICHYDPDNNRFVVANDLGLDQLLIYHFDRAKGTLAANQPAFASVEPGAGPRHSTFHPNGRFLYDINEIAGSISAFNYNAHSGAMRHLQTISTLPTDFKDKNDSAEIVVHPSGKFLYGSNRGPDTIAVFAIDSAKGTLKLVETVSTQGKAPRSFAIDPSGKYLLAANQDSNNVVVFRIDPKTGRLTATGQVLEIPSPVCLLFVPID